MYVLIVEDDALLALELKAELNDLGVSEVEWAEDVPSALENFQHNRPDFVVLDVNLGSDLAYPVAEELSARDIPFVFATGIDKHALPREWRSHVRIEKPVCRAALACALGIKA